MAFRQRSNDTIREYSRSANGEWLVREVPDLGRGSHPVRLGALVQILLTNGTWVQFAALVSGEIRQVHARVTLHAVTRIQAQAQPLTTQVAVGAVVDVMLRIVIP